MKMSAMEIDSAIEQLMDRLAMMGDEDRGTEAEVRVIMRVRRLQRLGGFEPWPLFRLEA
jgi:hypothetical protein